MTDSGLMIHWRAQFWPTDDACSLKTDGEITVKPVGVMDMSGIFFILGCGKMDNYMDKEGQSNSKLNVRIENLVSIMTFVSKYFFRFCSFCITVDV